MKAAHVMPEHELFAVVDWLFTFSLTDCVASMWPVVTPKYSSRSFCVAGSPNTLVPTSVSVGRLVASCDEFWDPVHVELVPQCWNESAPFRIGPF
ncbi:MAG TPA: hypothetical protein VE269_06745 [Gaiellaceae bacterium]|nr:hypothetical protein [Gaiellaceae bacterium]